MARGFNGSTDRIDYGNIKPTTGPQTFSGWLFSDDAVGGDERLFCQHAAGNGTYSVLIQLQNNNSIEFIGNTSAVTLKSYTANGTFSSGSWFHYLYTWDGSLTAANIHQYINNVEASYNLQDNGSGTMSAPAGSWSFGFIPADSNFDGALAAVGWWNRVLTADERKALSKGFSPLFIPNGLKFAPDLIRNQRDIISGEAGTLDGTSVREHPRIITPYSSSTIIVPSAQVVELSGSVSASSTIAGVLSVTKNIAGTIDANSSLIATLDKLAELSGSITATTTVNGAVDSNLSLAGTVSAVSGADAVASVLKNIAGIITATTTVVGSLTIIETQITVLIEGLGSIDIANFNVTNTFNLGNILGDITTIIRPGQNTNCDQGSAIVNNWSAPIPTEMDELSGTGDQEQLEQSPRDNNNLNASGKIRGHEYMWYEAAHLLPRIVQELGNLVSAQVINCDLYNADRDAKITVTSITNNLGTGIDVVGVPAVPFDIKSQDSLIFTLTVLTVGDVTINASYTLHLSTGEEYTIYITGSRVVILPIRPEAPLREHLLFDTKIIEAVDGSEQRIANRQYPRGMFEATYKYGQQLIEMILFDRQAKVVAVPAWHEPAFLNTAHASGLYTVNVNTTSYGNFYVGGYAVVLEDEYTYDALKIASITATSITFESELSFNYTKKAQVMPLLTAYIEASSASLKLPYNHQYFNLRIHVDPSVNDIASAAAFSTYNSEPFMDGPNLIEGGQLAEAIRTKVFVVDNLTGLRTQHSAWAHSKRHSKKGWKTNTRKELWELRQLLHYLKGRQVGFYIPTFWKDVTPTQDLVISTMTMTIKNIGYVINAHERWPKQVIRVHLKSGTILTRTIQDSSIISATEEQLTVDTAWPSTYEPDDIERIEFLEKVRIDVDDIIIVHYNSLGQAECIVPIREMENV